MIDAALWARQLLDAYRAAVKDPEQIETAFLRRAEAHVRAAQVDAASECLLIAQRQMNDAHPRMKPALGRLVDSLADLTLDVRTGKYPTTGRR